MTRHRLTDEQWDLIADLFPPPAKTGRKPTDRRLVVDAILWILNTGSQWRDLPDTLASACGCNAMVYERWGHGGSDPLFVVGARRAEQN